MSDITKHYLNREHGDRFVMRFCRKSDGYFVMYCEGCPADPHGKGASHHHLYPDGKLCQRDGYESKTFDHAEAFALWWMKRWSIYVRTGTFPMTSETIHVPDR